MAETAFLALHSCRHSWMSSLASPCNAWASWAGQSPHAPVSWPQPQPDQLPWSLAGNRPSVGLSAFPSPAGQRETAQRSCQRATPYISKIYFPSWPVKLPLMGSPACTAGLQRSKVDQDTFSQGRRRAARLQWEIPTVCTKVFQQSIPRAQRGDMEPHARRAARHERRQGWSGEQQQHSKAVMQPGVPEQKGLLHSRWRCYLLRRH